MFFHALVIFLCTPLAVLASGRAAVGPAGGERAARGRDGGGTWQVGRAPSVLVSEELSGVRAGPAQGPAHKLWPKALALEAKRPPKNLYASRCHTRNLYASTIKH